MKNLFILLFTLQFFTVTAQTKNSLQSTKKVYLAVGIIGGMSKPYATSGNENGIALSGFNSGVFIGGGMLQEVTGKVQLNHFVNVSNISPFFHYKLPVEDMSYTSLYGQPRSKYPAIFNIAAITYQLTAGYVLPFKKTTMVISSGAGINYVFNKSGKKEQTYLLIRAETQNGTYKNCIYTQKINRISFDVPFEIAAEQVAGYKKLRVGFRYNLAINARSTGSFSFDKDQGVATGNYRFIGSTAGLVLGWVIN